MCKKLSQISTPSNGQKHLGARGPTYPRGRSWLSAALVGMSRIAKGRSFERFGAAILKERYPNDRYILSRGTSNTMVLFDLKECRPCALIVSTSLI